MGPASPPSHLTRASAARQRQATKIAGAPYAVIGTLVHRPEASHDTLGVDKLLLMSIIFATVIIPAVAARLPNARRGIKRAVVFMVVFNVLYMVAIIKLWPRLLWTG